MNKLCLAAPSTVRSRLFICFYGILGKQEYLKKRSEFGLGSAFFGISDLGFLPYGVPIKGVIEKEWIFDDFFFIEKGMIQKSTDLGILDTATGSRGLGIPRPRIQGAFLCFHRYLLLGISACGGMALNSPATPSVLCGRAMGPAARPL